MKAFLNVLIIVICLFFVPQCGEFEAPEEILVADPLSGKEDSPEQNRSSKEGTTPLSGLPGDILATSLVIDIEKFTGSAAIRLAPTAQKKVAFEVQGLVITDVSGPAGKLAYKIKNGRLEVKIPPNQEIELQITYSFSATSQTEGYMQPGMTMVWPYHCGNLFPCHSNPSDGLLFDLQITGVPADQVAVYPARIPANAPSYQLAWAIGDYKHLDLGQTTAGTSVSVWYSASSRSMVKKATKNLVKIFDWYETTLGPYAYGNQVGSVEVDWGPGAYGGMEHHPFWHVDNSAMGDAVTHIHEAAHGWYGDGVRIRCWEDFVLSEGTTTYLTARAISQINGPEAESEIWDSYAAELEAVIASEDGIAWPDSCGQVDILKDGLFSNVPYLKGAYFYLAVSEKIGSEKLDQLLGDFYKTYQGQAMGMQDMLDFIHEQTGFDPTALAKTWLKSLGRP